MNNQLDPGSLSDVEAAPFFWSNITPAQRPILLGMSVTSILIAASVALAIQFNLLGHLTGLALATGAIIALSYIGAARHSAILHHRTGQRDGAKLALAQSEERLRLAQSAAGIATIDWNIANDHAVWSSNFVEVFGVPIAGMETRSPYEVFIALVHPDDRTRIDRLHFGILKTGGTFSEEFRIKLPNGSIRWIATRGEVLLDSAGVPHRLIGSNFDITERHLSEDKLKNTLAVIELANDAGEIGIWNKDLIARKGTWDERTRLILGLEGHGQKFSFTAFRRVIHADDWARVKSTLNAAIRSGEKFAVECRIIHNAKNTRWVRIRGQSDIDPLSHLSVRMTGIIFDITERREREKHIRILMRELTHRSKNLLTVIQAMARQTGNAATSLEDFQTRFSARLQGLSASHDLLINENWRGAFITDIVRSQIGHFSDLIGSRIRLHGQNVLLKPEAAQNIGLALHELSTNAAKYGALAQEGGYVDIAWHPTLSAEGEARLEVIWQESGGPDVIAPERRGFGSVVTERIVARALDGHVDLAFQPGGVKWTLDIPAKYILAATATA